LPSSPATKLSQGKTVSARIDVRNMGNINKDFFTDARLNAQSPRQLVPFGQVNAVPLPLSLNAQLSGSCRRTRRN
jgi:hypothetical protein